MKRDGWHSFYSVNSRDKRTGEKPQQALTASILRRLHNINKTHLEVAISQLLIGAFFFAMRSCEYSAVNGTRRTKIITIGNIVFRQGPRIIPHDDPNLPQADYISITFIYQKRDERNETITMQRSGDIILCPIRAWAHIVQRIRSYPGTSTDSPVNTCHCPENQLLQIQAKTILAKLRQVVTSIGSTSLGFSAD
ncbi:MAG: hypothetical protein ACREOZ_00350, partial [Gloeomargaritales cyanobacterium]